MAPRSLAAALLALIALPVWPVAGAFPDPIPPGDHVPVDAVAFHAMQERLLLGGLFQIHEGSQLFHVKDQMLGVLVYLRMAERDPENAEAWRQDALRLWRASAAYHQPAKYYFTSVTTESRCIQPDANAWALAASLELGRVLGPDGAEARARAAELSDTLSQAVRTGSANNVDVCNPSLGQLPLVLWVLLEYHRHQPSSVVRQAVQDGLARILDQAFDDAFYDASDVYHVDANALLLMVLGQADERFGTTAYATKHEALLGFFQDHLVRRTGTGAVAVPVLRDADRTRLDSAHPESMLWAAYALSRTDGVEPSLVRGLIQTTIDRFWDDRTGGIVPENRQLHATTNALAVLFTQSPAVARVGSEGSNMHLIVRASARFTYPSPVEPSSSAWLLANEATERLAWEADAPGPMTLLYPTHALGDFHFGFPPSSFYPRPHLVREADGQEVPLSIFGPSGRFVLIEGADAPTGRQTYRLVGYVPVAAVDYAYEDRITLRLSNPLGREFLMPRLVLELEAVNVEFTRVAVNDIAFGQYQAATVPANVYLGTPHTRMTLSSIPLRPGVNTVTISYDDVEEPRANAFGLFRDRGLNEPLGLADAASYTALTGQLVYAGVHAVDNARVASVLLEARMPGRAEATIVPLDPVVNRPGWYSGPVPPPTSTGRASLSIIVQDASGNLGGSDPIDMEVRSSLLAGSSLVLFVFAALLFFATAFIYFKVRRRGP